MSGLVNKIKDAMGGHKHQEGDAARNTYDTSGAEHEGKHGKHDYRADHSIGAVGTSTGPAFNDSSRSSDLTGSNTGSGYDDSSRASGMTGSNTGSGYNDTYDNTSSRPKESMTDKIKDKMSGSSSNNRDEYSSTSGMGSGTTGIGSGTTSGRGTYGNDEHQMFHPTQGRTDGYHVGGTEATTGLGGDRYTSSNTGGNAGLGEHYTSPGMSSGMGSGSGVGSGMGSARDEYSSTGSGMGGSSMGSGMTSGRDEFSSGRGNESMMGRAEDRLEGGRGGRDEYSSGSALGGGGSGYGNENMSSGYSDKPTMSDKMNPMTDSDRDGKAGVRD